MSMSEEMKPIARDLKPLKISSCCSWSQTPQRPTTTATAGPATTATTTTAATPDDDSATPSDQHQAGARMPDRGADAGPDAARVAVERIRKDERRRRHRVVRIRRQHDVSVEADAADHHRK